MMKELTPKRKLGPIVKARLTSPMLMIIETESRQKKTPPKKVRYRDETGLGFLFLLIHVHYTNVLAQ